MRCVLDNSIDLVMISTTQPEKQICLHHTIPTLIDKFKFKNCFIGIDIIQNNQLNNNLKNILHNLNFQIDMHVPNGMVKNLESVIHLLKSDWVLYCEDDVNLDDFPNFNDLLDFISINFDGNVGIIDVLNAPGVRWNKTVSSNFKLNFLDKSFHKSYLNYHLFERTIDSYDLYYINFPMILIRREIFQSCFDFAIENCKKSPIEQGFTFAYYAMGYHNIYKKIHIWNNLNFKIDDCIHLSGTEIAENYLSKNMLVKHRLTHPNLKFLNTSVLNNAAFSRIDIYSF